MAGALPAARCLRYAAPALAVGVPVLMLCSPAAVATTRLRRLPSGGLAGSAVGTAATQVAVR